MVLAALAVLLHKWTREEDVSIATSTPSGSMVVVRTQVNGTDFLKRLVLAMQEELALVALKAVPFSSLLQVIRGDVEDDGNSLPVSCFLESDSTFDGAFQPSAQCDWLLLVGPKTLRLQYNRDLFAPEKMQDMLAQLKGVLHAAITAADAVVGEISMITDFARQVCPDPKAPLDSTYCGSIQSILQRRATEDPNRTLAVSNRGSYTYGEVNRLANRVAQFLLAAGVRPEERVAIYAHRSCPLMVAMLGILKAGATVTMIDPAYPASRQVIYFEVATPTALVMIKAAGALPADTEKFVHGASTVKAVLRDFDMAMLQAGQEGQLAGLPEEDPLVEVGPHHICTLSFTSGTTGIPKGVQGRHISLTHFYPWMGTEFGLGQEDRFTMLSGIAHDPIQRDVFTPIFFGAELHIPDQEDIATPGQLARWCASRQVTVTHLTPAMGQLLTSNATASIPSLHNAFFVGDVLAKQDVSRLRQLAPNVTVVNMYGTTETQRSVSYLKLPPDVDLGGVKDLLPAGRGMQDVQLLVLTDRMRQAGLGEAGEIYVRSYHLAKGYLGLEQATAEKFLPNPFNPSDPNDRLYRTGDVGRYLANGVVECAGRADDQVKIRGFRVELREIDTFLMQHPKVREAVTLLRRDVGPEPRLVAYFVPEADDFQVSEIRDFLKTQLPTYAVPADLVPLTRMPLNPNGKVDRPRLPLPGPPAAAPASPGPTVPMTLMEQRVWTIWTEVLRCGDLGLDDHFFDVGGHSVLAQQVVFQLQQRIDPAAGPGLLFDCPTVRSLAAALEARAEGRATCPHSQAEVDLTGEVAALLAQPEVQAALCRGQADGPTLEAPAPDAVRGVLLTGATGFLGVFLLAAFAQRCPSATLYCLTRAADAAAAHARLTSTLEAHGLDGLVPGHRYVGVVGDLEKPLLGLGEEAFSALAEAVDLVVHNGALVHWVYPYSRLRAANVHSTVQCLRLAATGARLKSLHFVSSTSVLDTPYYMQQGRVLEADNLDGAARGLGAGYGQSKWVSERLLMAAQAAGFPATIVRPGYISGHSTAGVTNADDFLCRILKGCVELGCSPLLGTKLNMCPVDYVAGATACVALQPRCRGRVFHMANPHPFTFDQYFDELRTYGWAVAPVPYVEWARRLRAATAQGGEGSALFPLLHFVLDDLPAATAGPLLDDSNTKDAISGTDVRCPPIPEVMGNYLAYLVQVGFLPPPPADGPHPRPLPSIAAGKRVLTRTRN